MSIVPSLQRTLPQEPSDFSFKKNLQTISIMFNQVLKLQKKLWLLYIYFPNKLLMFHTSKVDPGQKPLHLLRLSHNSRSKSWQSQTISGCFNKSVSQRGVSWLKKKAGVEHLQLSSTTLPETHIAPENEWLEDLFPFGMAYFQGTCWF